MKYEACFRRWEIKYRLDLRQKEQLLDAMANYMEPDRYGRSVIRNVYYDTDNYRLIRRSLEKPVYKEKLRLRSYRRLNQEDPAFLELKKKYKGVVYKRRIALPNGEAMDFLAGKTDPPPGQIAREIAYFRSQYPGLSPAVFLSYEREAYFGKEDKLLRITFDSNILARQEALSLCYEPGGVLLLPQQQVLMEIKTAGAIPLWLTGFLTQQKIYKTSFSKYGTAYETMILPQYLQGGLSYAK